MDTESTESLRNLLKNKTRGYLFISNYLTKYELDIQFVDPLILLLLSNHPNKEKINGLEYCILRLDPIYKQKTLYIKTKTLAEDSISWKTCVDSVLGKHDKDRSHIASVKLAFRFATFDEKRKQYFVENTTDNTASCMCCTNKCYSKHLNKPPSIHVDHCGISFEEILSLFISHKSTTLASVDIEYVGLQSYLKDKILKDEWLEWHNDKATYRILCQDCNLKFGNKSNC